MKKQLNMNKFIIFFILFILTVDNYAQQIVFKSNGKINYSLSIDEVALLDSIQHKTFLFFQNEHHPEKGIVKDRAESR